LKDNPEAHVSLAVKSDNIVDQEKEVCKLLTESMDGSKLDALICVAGGWVGGNAASKGNYYLKNAIF
jgi:PREDICTED: quinoid dihydropteridine reductase-like